VRIELSDLTLVYDGVRALDGLNAIVDGRIIGVLGANASGKTSPASNLTSSGAMNYT
jgi:ABC-type multidrug transport system ATPase subunit